MLPSEYAELEGREKQMVLAFIDQKKEDDEKDRQRLDRLRKK